MIPVRLSFFRADVREGPSAKTVVSGVLAMTDALQGPTASFLGGGGEAMDVPMTLENEAITLDFALPSGTVHGVGTLPFSMEGCEGEMEGPLTSSLRGGVQAAR